MESPEHKRPSLEAPSSFDSDKGDDEILTILQSVPTSCSRSPIATTLGKAFELASKPPQPPPENSEGESVKVFLRIRPTAEGETSCLEVKSDGCSVRATPPPPIDQKKEFKDARDYSFTKVLDTSSTQSDVYDQTAKEIVNDFCNDGKSGLIFTFGVTNAGKSFTVLGNQDAPGVLPRSLENICSCLDETDYLSISYLEIYNEQVFDLLETSENSSGLQKSNSFNSAFSSLSSTASDRQRKHLQIRDRGGKVVVDGLSNHSITTAKQAMLLIESGSKSRQTCSHNLNSDSSRSHSVCSIQLIRKGNLMTDEELKEQIPAVLYIVDLAGSERGERTGAGGTSKKQNEANAINSSLFTLMQCLGSLNESNSGNGNGNGNKRNFVSKARYRESKLTKLLQPHLSGNSNGPGGSGSTCMIVNANPRSSDFIETCYVLSTTAPCTKIKIKSSSLGSSNGNGGMNSLSSSSLLAAASKFDMNGRKIKSNSFTGTISNAVLGSSGNGNNKNMPKKRSITDKDAMCHPMTQRARTSSNDSISSSSSSSGSTASELKAAYKKIDSLKNEIETLKTEFENEELIFRQECGDEMDKLAQKIDEKESMLIRLRSNGGQLLSVSEEDENDENGNGYIPPLQKDILQSARKKKMVDDIQQIVDDLKERCEDYEDELNMKTAEIKTLSSALASARYENDRKKEDGDKSLKLLDDDGEEIKPHIPERWIMLDFLTQLLIAPDTMMIEDFNNEQIGLMKGLESVSFSSPMRNCATKIKQPFDNENNKVENFAKSLREALQLNNKDDTKEAYEKSLIEIESLKQQLNLANEKISTLESTSKTIEVVEEALVVAGGEEGNNMMIDEEVKTNEPTTSENAMDEDTQVEDTQVDVSNETSDAMNPLMTMQTNSITTLESFDEDENDQHTTSSSFDSITSSEENTMNTVNTTTTDTLTDYEVQMKVPPKIITQLATIDPNSPVKHVNNSASDENVKKCQKITDDRNSKYSPSVIGNMQKRIREKAGKKTKTKAEKKQAMKASPRRTRSSTLFLRV